MSKLNNKGQTLIMFVILLPIFLLLMALVIDMAYLYKENTKLTSVTKMIIKNTYQKRQNDNIEELILDLYKKNNMNSNNVKIENKESYLKITNEYKIESIFGKIIGIENYDIKVSLKGYEKNQKIVIKKE